MIEAEKKMKLPLRFLGEPLELKDFFPVVISKIREEGVSCVLGDHMTGIEAIAVPVFDQEGALAMSLTVLGPQGALDLSPESATRKIVVEAGARLSKRLGYRAK